MATNGELPKKYKAVVYDEPGKVSTKVVDLDMPEPGAGEVLINLSVPATTSHKSTNPNHLAALTPASATPI